MEYSELVEVFSTLYTDDGDIRRVLNSVEIPAVFIDLDDSAINVWGNVLEEAQNRNKITAIIDFAVSEYPENLSLSKLKNTQQLTLIDTRKYKHKKGKWVESLIGKLKKISIEVWITSFVAILAAILPLISPYLQSLIWPSNPTIIKLTHAGDIYLKPGDAYDINQPAMIAVNMVYTKQGQDTLYIAQEKVILEMDGITYKFDWYAFVDNIETIGGCFQLLYNAPDECLGESVSTKTFVEEATYKKGTLFRANELSWESFSDLVINSQGEIATLKLIGSVEDAIENSKVEEKSILCTLNLIQMRKEFTRGRSDGGYGYSCETIS